MSKHVIMMIPEEGFSHVALRLALHAAKGGLTGPLLLRELQPNLDYLATYESETQTGVDHKNRYAPNNAEVPGELYALIRGESRLSAPRVLITVSGGVVTDVCSDGPVEYIVKDFDNINEGGQKFDPAAFEQASLENPHGFALALTEDLDDDQLVGYEPPVSKPVYLPGHFYWLRWRVDAQAPWDEWTLHWYDHFEPKGGFRNAIGGSLSVSLADVEAYPNQYEVQPVHHPEAPSA